MSETTCKQSPLDHQRDISHEQKEMPSSPKAPPRRKKPQNVVCSDADEEKEKVINSTEGVQRAKLNPRPPLPPRPTGRSPVHTPSKKSPNTPTQPPPPRTKHPPHTTEDPPHTKDSPRTNDPPQKPDHPKTNETPSSPRPSRPPQPSRQASIKTTNLAPEKPKPPEIKRTPKIVEQKTEDKISKNESYLDSSQNNTEPVPYKKATPGKPQRPPEPSSAGNITKKEPNKNHEHQTPAQDSMPEAEVPDQKKLNRPPRPIVPPVHHPTIQSDETATPDSQKSLEKKRPPKPNRTSFRESQVDSHVAQQLEKLPDEGKPSQLPDVPEPSQLTDTQEHEKGKSPKVNRPPKPTRPGSVSEVHASPAHGEAKKEEDEKPPQATDELETSKSPELGRPPKPTRPGSVSEVHASPAHGEAKKEEVEKPPQATDELETSKSHELGRPPKPTRPGSEAHASPTHSEATKEEGGKLSQTTDEKSKSPKLGRLPKPGRPGSVSEVHASPAHGEAKKEEDEKPPQATDELETSKSPKLGRPPKPTRPGSVSEVHASPAHGEAKKEEVEKPPQATDELETSKSPKLGRLPKPTRPGSVSEVHASPAHGEAKKEEVEKPPQATDELETSKSPKLGRLPKPTRPGSEAHASPTHSEATKEEGGKLSQTTDEKSKSPKLGRPPKPGRPGSVSEVHASPAHGEAKKEEVEKPPQATDELETSKSPKLGRPPKPTRPGSVSEVHASPAHGEAKKEEDEKPPQATDELETSKSPKLGRPPKPTRPGSVSEVHASPAHGEAKKEEDEKPPQATDELETSKSPKLGRPPKPTRPGSVSEVHASPAHGEAKKEEDEKPPQATDELETSKSPKLGRPPKPTRPGSVSEVHASPAHGEAKKEEDEKPPQATDELETSKSPKLGRPPKPTRPGSVSEAHASAAHGEATKEEGEKLPQATDELETSKSLKSTGPPKPTRPGSVSEAHASAAHSEATKEEGEKLSQTTDELETSKSLKSTGPPKPTRPGSVSEAPASPAHSEDKKEEVEKAQKHKPHNEKPSRPSLPKERAGSLHAAQPVKDPYQESCKPPEPCKPVEPCKTPEICKSPETGKSPETPKSSKCVRPPPPNRPVHFKKFEKSDSLDSKKGNTSSKEQKKTDGSTKEENSNKPETGEKRQSVLFRVSSFSKTEVESFNKETSFGKPKQDGGYRVRASSKEDKKPGKTRPPVLPKPRRKRPPPPQLKKADDKNEPERESKEKGKGKEHGDMDEGGVAVVGIANENRGVESLEDKHVDTLLEKETTTGKKKVKKKAPGIPEDAKKECSTHTTKEKAISVPDHKLSTSTDKERTVGITGERMGSDNLKSETLNTEVNIGASKECDKSTQDLGCVSDKQSTKDRKRVSLETSKVEGTKIASEVPSITETTTAQRDKENTKLEGDIEEEQKTMLENEAPHGQGNLNQSGVEDKKELNTENYLTNKEIVVKDENQETMKDNVEKHFDVGKYLTAEENVSEKVNESRNDEFEGERTELVKVECLTVQKPEHYGTDRKEDGLNMDVKQDLRVEKHEENTKGGINTSLDEKHIAEKKTTINVMGSELQANVEEVKGASCSEDLGILSKPCRGINDVKETKDVETSEEKSPKEIIMEIQESPDLSKETETGEGRNELKESEEESICVEVNAKMAKTQNATVCLKDAEDLDKKTVVLDVQAVKSEEIKKGDSSGDAEGSVNLEVSLGDTEGSVMVDKNTGVARGQDGNSRDIVGKTQTTEDSEVIVRAQEVSVSESVPSNDEPTSTPREDTGVSREDASASRDSIVKEVERKSSECLDSHVAATSESTILVAQEIPASAEKNLVPTDKPSVQSSKRKPPPPKPKRTSSLKRESRPLIEKTNDSNDQLNEITEEKGAEKPTAPQMSPASHSEPEVSPTIDTDPQVSPTNHTDPQVSPTSHTDPQVPPMRNVVFHTDVMKLKESSSSVSRSKSFTSAAKGRTKNGPSSKPETGTKENSGAEGGALSRSYSFGGLLRKRAHTPPRPSPPTFFVEPFITTEDEGKEDEGKEDGGKEHVDENTADDQGKSNSIEELEKIDKPMKDDSKHDSLTLDNTTDDTESESEKEDLPQKSKTYYILREILSTERTFVDVTKLVSEDFMEALKKGSKKFDRPIIPEETLHDIVLNITQIYDFDREFLKALENRMKTWDDQQRIGDIIKKFSPFLKMYKTYIQGYDNAMAVLTEALKKYPQFAEVVREFECSERCQNLTVGMYMLKPIQRIPSYRLLLKDYLKHLSKESLDYKDVSDALAIVSDVATHINEDMKRVDNFEEVLKVQRSLVGQVEIVKPGRDLIKEGALMKSCRKDMQPRMFFLFTDVLLYTTPVANNQYRLNLSLPLGEIKVEIPASPEFDNEFSIISTKKSFTLSASTAEERDEWLEALRNASDEIRKKRITFRLAQKEKMEALADTPQDGEDKNAKLGSKAPVWIPDVRVTMCMLCTDDFTVTNRRHHCRACGKVVCGSCSSNSTPLPYLNDETARVCDYCYDELTVTSPASSLTTNASENGDAAEQNDSSSENSPVQKRTPPEVAHRKKPKKFNIFKSKEVPAVEESTISGYLKTRIGKKWHKRWYVVKDNVLYTSKASSDVAAQETCPLLGYDVRGPEKMDGDSKKIVFQLIHAGTQPVVLQTDNIKSAERWVNALRRATILPL